MEEFTINRHQVHIVCATEKRFGSDTNLEIYKGLKILRVKTGDITSSNNYLSKGFALLRLQSQLIKASKKYFTTTKFDLIIYSTPPIQYNRIIKFLKKQSQSAVTYLLLKDIFPQNAVDLRLLSKWNPIYWYFRQQEKKTYNLSDYIGCMSPANVSYLLKHNSKISSSKVSVCANSLKNKGRISESQKVEIRKKIRKNFSVSEEELLIIYGGNLGIAQGLDFLMEILKTNRNNKSIRFLVVGEGTWYLKIEEFLNDGIVANIILQKRVSTDVFKEMLIASDLGLIFLHPKFTIPNFPSRLTSYLEIGLPTISCTDNATDIGDIIESSGCGYKVISGDINRFNEILSKLTERPELLNSKSINARILFEKMYTTALSYNTIVNSINKVI